MELPIYLIGYMGAGKTTVGRLLAERLGWHFVDLDEAFAEINGQTPAQYIRQYGVEAFRKREKDCVEELSELPIQKVIYATGGGYPCWEDNMECLKELGTSVYLRWSDRHLAQRLEIDNTDRPLLQDKSGKDLQEFVAWQMSGREPFYAQADLVIDAPLSRKEQLSAEDDEELAQYLYERIRKELL